MGVLYPEVEADAPIQMSIEEDVENDVEAEAGGDAPDNVVDPAVSMSRVRYPRSMGLTIALDHTQDASLEVLVTATRYESVGETEWRAVDIQKEPVLVPAHPPRLERLDIVDGLQLVVHSREPRGGTIAMTITLVNTQAAPPGRRTPSRGSDRASPRAPSTPHCASVRPPPWQAWTSWRSAPSSCSSATFARSRSVTAVPWRGKAPTRMRWRRPTCPATRCSSARQPAVKGSSCP